MTCPRQVVVLGSGGHAVVCIDSLLATGFDVIGALDRHHDDRLRQVPVLGNDDEMARLRAQGISAAFVAVGDNGLRERLIETARGAGLELVNAISPGSHVSPSVVLGENIAIMAGAVINAYASLADGVIVNTAAGIDHDVQIGAVAHIGPGCHLAGKVTIAEGAFLGVGSVVSPECHVGRWSQLGAGSVVVGDISDGMLAMGVPAREVRKLHE